jgi:hypothetical protein
MGIRVNPQQQYQSVSDSELLHLAEEYDHLVPEAQEALLAELQRRGLTEGVKTAKSVEADAAAATAAAAAGPNYLTVTEASGRMAGSFQVIAPRTPVLRFPRFCPRCGKPADKTLGIGQTHAPGPMVPVQRLETLNFNVPHCSNCVRHRWNLLIPIFVLIAVLVIVAIGVGVLMDDRRVAMTAASILSLLSILAIKLRRGRAPLNVPEGIFMLDYDEQSVWFLIRDRNYAEKFCEMNREFLFANAS